MIRIKQPDQHNMGTQESTSHHTGAKTWKLKVVYSFSREWWRQ